MVFESWQRVVQSWSSLYPNTHTHWQQKKLKESLSKSMANLPGELLITLYMEPLKETISKSRQSWSGTHMVNLFMESLRNSFRNQ